MRFLILLAICSGALMAQEGSPPIEPLAVKQKELDAANAKVTELAKELGIAKTNLLIADKLVLMLRKNAESCSYSSLFESARQEAAKALSEPPAK